jgi:hypothetical protein
MRFFFYNTPQEYVHTWSNYMFMKHLIIILFILQCFLNTQLLRAECVNGTCTDGYGTYKWGDGNTYTGEWKNGQPDGKGILVSPYGTTYSGQWKQNRLHGKGRLTYYNGDVYVGEFKHGKRHGKGILYDKDHKIIKKGTWKNDVFVGK